ncbi:MAG: M48 family metalloprotease [Desulfatitalea sp.]|nr:M48 family metalloprotease [Desulfatitalea sp.]
MARRHFRKALSLILAVILPLVWCGPAGSISIKEEQELSQQFMRMISRYFEIVEDPQINDYVGQMGRKIISTLPPQPFNYHFYVIKEEVYNAFAIPAGCIFINSGLLLAMDDEEELAGILSHEIAHVVSRHLSHRIDRSKKIDLATAAGMVAGIFLGVAGGSAEVGQAVLLGSAAAGQTAALAYSREDESQADHLGLGYLEKSGYSAEGLLAVLKKIRGKQWFGSDQVPTYMMTHPAVEERIVYIDTWISTQKDQDHDRRPSGQFRRMQLRLRALYGEPNAMTQFFKNGMAQNPSNPDWAYGYGLVLARMGQRKDALPYLQQVLAKNAMDPLILGDVGKIYFENGQIGDALRVLQGVDSLPGSNPEALFYLGRAYMEQGNYAAAAEIFERLVQRQEEYTPTYRFLGETYGNIICPMPRRAFKNRPSLKRSREPWKSSENFPSRKKKSSRIADGWMGSATSCMHESDSRHRLSAHHHALSKCEKCMLKVPRPWVAERKAVE